MTSKNSESQPQGHERNLLLSISGQKRIPYQDLHNLVPNGKVQHQITTVGSHLQHPSWHSRGVRVLFKVEIPGWVRHALCLDNSWYCMPDGAYRVYLISLARCPLSWMVVIIVKACLFGGPLILFILIFSYRLVPTELSIV